MEESDCRKHSQYIRRYDSNFFFQTRNQIIQMLFLTEFFVDEPRQYICFLDGVYSSTKVFLLSFFSTALLRWNYCQE